MFKSSFRAALLILTVASVGCSRGSVKPGNGLSPPTLHLDGGTCTSAQTLCSGHCVNTNTDPANCGVCGSACDSSHSCQGGTCVAPDGGTTTTGTCPGSQTSCGGSCTDTSSDPLNCGACSNPCTAAETCTNGACVAPTCAAGQTSCAGACTDVTSDANNCGACGNSCDTGQVCMLSQCATGVGPQPGVDAGTTTTCNANQTSCNGSCTDTTADANNCGACNSVCPAGNSCSGGQCVPGMTSSGGATCSDTVTCLNNCGQTDQTCQQGCATAASPQALNLLQAVLDCIDTACPSTNGGVCDSTATHFSQTKCDNCSMTAQGGTCSGQLTACINDMGSTTTTPDMGMTTPTCPGTQTSCGGTCTQTATDVSNCGACGNACTFGQTCTAGACVAASTCKKHQMSCGGVCVTPASDNNNCGGCGVVCTSKQICDTGTCVTDPGAGCDGTLECINNCDDDFCQEDCYDSGSNNGDNLLNDLTDCLDNACPSFGGVCDDSDPFFDETACEDCYDTAQNTKGACDTALQACIADGQ